MLVKSYKIKNNDQLIVECDESNKNMVNENLHMEHDNENVE